LQDYEYIESNSELDDCGGRFAVTPEYPEGTYYYVLTDNWPYIPRCLNGSQVDNSFQIGPNCTPSNAEESCSQEDFFGIDVELQNSRNESIIYINLNTTLKDEVRNVAIFTKKGQLLYEANSFEKEIQIKNNHYKYVFIQMEWNNEQFTKRITL
jgi:hypothetical protein